MTADVTPRVTSPASAPAAPGADLSNQRLAWIVALAGVAAAMLTILLVALPHPWGAPGGPILQAAAALGAVLLLASFAAVMAKRFGGKGKRAFHSHVWLASIGAALVFVHAASNLGRPPALLLAALAGLIALGVWSRMAGARRFAAVFGEKRRGFRRPDPETRRRLAALLAAKQALLARIDPAADERLFAPSAIHWRRSPFRTIQYVRLAAEEERLTGARAALGPEARWRMVHRLLAWGFVGGLLLHVIIVMWFAGYVADGREIYWLRFADWDF